MIKLWRLVWNILVKIPEKLRFLLVGGFNTVVSYLMFVGFTYWFGANYYQLSLVLAWMLSSVISFSTQKIFVFCTKGKWLKEYCKCCMSWMVAYLINAGMLELVVRVIGWNVYIGQGVAIVITTVVTYILFKKFAFKRS
jgi:putative flippase GtrA